MNVLEILVILFIILPFIKHVIDGIKEQGKQQQEREKRQQTREAEEQRPWDQPEDYAWGEPDHQQESTDSWQDALSELEELLTGQPAPKKQTPPPPPKPEPEIKFDPPSQSRDLHRQEDTATFYQKKQSDIGTVDASSDLMDTDNPIYKSINESPEVTVDEAGKTDYAEKAHDPDVLRDAFIIREILDTPSSLRRIRR